MSTSRRKTKQSEKARRVAFYRNGDYFDAGARLAFRGNKPFSTMPHLLDYLSQKIHIPAKKIFDLEDGKPIKSLDQLEDGKSYVVSSENKYEPMPYGAVPRLQTSHVADALPIRPEDLELLRPPQTSKKKRTRKLDDLAIERLYTGRREGRLITIAARKTGARATLLFSDKNILSFEEVLKDFGNTLGLNKVEKMFTPSGREVRSISQLKNEFHDSDTFILDEREVVVPQHYQNVKSARATGAAKSTTVRGKQRKEESRGIPSVEWIHGYDGGTLLLLESGELVYPVAAAVVLFDRNAESQRQYLGHSEDVCSVCVHPSGRIMASGQASSKNQMAAVHIWMTETLKSVSSITRLSGSPISIAFSSRDYVLMTVEAGTEEDSLSFWDWESEALLARVQMQGDRLTGGIFHPTEPELAVTFGVHHLAFWKRRSDGFLGRADALAPGHSGRTILSWAFVGDSSLAVGDSSGYITLWALLPEQTFKIAKEVKAHSGEITALLAMREGTLISGGGDQLKAWDAHQKLMPLTTIELPEGDVKSISPQGLNDVSLYVGTSHAVLVGSLQSSFTTMIQGTEAETLDIAVDSKGVSFVTVDKAHNIYLWIIQYLVWRTKSLVDLCCVGYHPEERAVIAGGTNGKLVVLHADGGSVVATISVADMALKSLAYSSDGSSLAIGCEDGNIYVCESRNHGYLYKMHTVLKNDWPILQIDWSSDNQCIQSSYRKDDFCEVTLWKVSEAKVLKSALSKTKDWPEHTCNLSHNVIGIWKKLEGAFFLSCHRKGSKLATGSQDGYIRIFPYPYGENEKTDPEEWKQSSKPANAVRFLQKYALIAATGTAIFIWNIKQMIADKKK